MSYPEETFDQQSTKATEKYLGNAAHRPAVHSLFPLTVSYETCRSFSFDEKERARLIPSNSRGSTKDAQLLAAPCLDLRRLVRAKATRPLKCRHLKAATRVLSIKDWPDGNSPCFAKLTDRLAICFQGATITSSNAQPSSYNVGHFAHENFS